MKFHYGDKVKVIKGFYTGTEGIVVGRIAPSVKICMMKTKLIPGYYTVSYKSVNSDIREIEYFEEEWLEKIL